MDLSNTNETTKVTITDYPAPTIIETLKTNVSKNIPKDLQSRVTVQSHIWGSLADAVSTSKKGHYTRILASDTLWLASQNQNLARSMLHFLSPDPSARVFVIAGFHTGRARLAHFFEEVVDQEGLEVEEIFEMDADGRRRSWKADRTEEGVGERKKWLVLARLKRCQHSYENSWNSKCEER